MKCSSMRGLRRPSRAVRYQWFHPFKKLTRTPRPPRGHWPFLLFLLDATAAGATNSEIADSFDHDPLNSKETPDSRLIRQRLRVAQALQKPDGYLQIACLP